MSVVNVRLPKTRASWLISAVSLLVVLIVAVLLLVPREPPSSHLDVSALPLLNASLNAASGILLAAGYVFIRRRQWDGIVFVCWPLSACRPCSWSSTSSIMPWSAPPSLPDRAGSDLLYFTILISHIILATLVLPLALTTLYRAWQGIFVQHRQIARLTLPIWFYVSVSGVVIYVMLYHLPA